MFCVFFVSYRGKKGTRRRKRRTRSTRPKTRARPSRKVGRKRSGNSGKRKQSRTKRTRRGRQGGSGQTTMIQTRWAEPTRMAAQPRCAPRSTHLVVPDEPVSPCGSASSNSSKSGSSKSSTSSSSGSSSSSSESDESAKKSPLLQNGALKAAKMQALEKGKERAKPNFLVETHGRPPSKLPTRQTREEKFGGSAHHVRCIEILKSFFSNEHGYSLGNLVHHYKNCSGQLKAAMPIPWPVPKGQGSSRINRLSSTHLWRASAVRKRKSTICFHTTGSAERLQCPSVEANITTLPQPNTTVCVPNASCSLRFLPKCTSRLYLWDTTSIIERWLGSSHCWGVWLATNQHRCSNRAPYRPPHLPALTTALSKDRLMEANMESTARWHVSTGLYPKQYSACPGVCANGEKFWNLSSRARVCLGGNSDPTIHRVWWLGTPRRLSEWCTIVRPPFCPLPLADAGSQVPVRLQFKIGEVMPMNWG